MVRDMVLSRLLIRWLLLRESTSLTYLRRSYRKNRIFLAITLQPYQAMCDRRARLPHNPCPFTRRKFTHSMGRRHSVSIRQRDRASHVMSAHFSHAISNFTTLCSNAFPEAANLALKIRTQARPGRTVRTWRLIFAHIQSAWNYQKRFIVNGER